MGLPTCKSQEKYWKQFWTNCNVDSNPIGRDLIGKARTDAIRQDCCEQVSCRDPWSINLPCPKPAPDPMPGPHFGVQKTTFGARPHSGTRATLGGALATTLGDLRYKNGDGSWIGVL